MDKDLKTIQTKNRVARRRGIEESAAATDFAKRPKLQNPAQAAHKASSDAAGKSSSSHAISKAGKLDVVSKQLNNVKKQLSEEKKLRQDEKDQFESQTRNLQDENKNLKEENKKMEGKYTELESDNAILHQNSRLYLHASNRYTIQMKHYEMAIKSLQDYDSKSLNEFTEKTKEWAKRTAPRSSEIVSLTTLMTSKEDPPPKFPSTKASNSTVTKEKGINKDNELVRVVRERDAYKSRTDKKQKIIKKLEDQLSEKKQLLDEQEKKAKENSEHVSNLLKDLGREKSNVLEVTQKFYGKCAELKQWSNVTDQLRQITGLLKKEFTDVQGEIYDKQKELEEKKEICHKLEQQLKEIENEIIDEGVVERRACTPPLEYIKKLKKDNLELKERLEDATIQYKKAKCTSDDMRKQLKVVISSVLDAFHLDCQLKQSNHKIRQLTEKVDTLTADKTVLYEKIAQIDQEQASSGTTPIPVLTIDTTDMATTTTPPTTPSTDRQNNNNIIDEIVPD